MSPTYRHTNTAIRNHPMIGRTFTYMPDSPDQWDGTYHPGLIVAPGMSVRVKAVFEDWNGIPGLDMLYVYVGMTDHHTHLSPREVPVLRLEHDGFDNETHDYSLSDCGFYSTSVYSRPWWAVDDCAGPRVGDTRYGPTCEHHHNRIPVDWDERERS